VWYTSPPALSDMSCRSRVICVGMLAEPARCGTKMKTTFPIYRALLHHGVTNVRRKEKNRNIPVAEETHVHCGESACLLV